MKVPKVIYLVDDDDAVRDSARALLEAYGLPVRDFPSAAALLEQTRGEGGDCLVLDLHMPGMSGLELLELLRKRGILVPAILLTGRFDSALSERMEKAGTLATLQKPVETSVLLEWIERAIGSG